MLKKILNYLRYPSTWSGIAKFLGVVGGFVGWQVSEEMSAAIAAAGVAVSGLIDMLFSDSDVA